MNKFDNAVGIIGLAVGMIGVGYALGARSKMTKISEKIDMSIDDIANKTPVDISDSLIERATEKAVAYEVKQAVSKATDATIADMKRDIHKQVSDAINTEYSSIKTSVLNEITNEAAKIDVNRVRADIEKAAKEAVMDKLDTNMDQILENFNEQLKNTTKIYNSIANTMSPVQSVKPTVLIIG